MTSDRNPIREVLLTYATTHTMSAISGIGVSQELIQAFSAAVETKNIRFIKVVIHNGARSTTAN